MTALKASDFVIGAPRSANAVAIAALATSRFAAVQAAGGKTPGIKDIASGRSDQFAMNPYLIKVKEGFNAREFESQRALVKLDELAQSIAQHGVKVALTVFRESGNIYLVDGERRLRATLRAIEVYGAKIESIPVVTEARGDNDASRVVNQFVMNSGEKFTPMEMSVGIKKLMAFGKSIPDIAKDIGLSVSYVGLLVDLSALPAKIQSMIGEGEIAATTALKAYRDSGEDAAKTIETLESGLVVAKAAGRTKVTARSIGPAKTSTKTELATKIENLNDIKEFLGRATVAIDAEDAEDVMVQIMMSPGDWDRVKAILSI